MSGGGGSRTQTQTSSTQMDPQLQEYRNWVLEQGKAEAQKGYNPYTGKRFADQSSETTKAQNMLKGQMGQYGGMYDDAILRNQQYGNAGPAVGRDNFLTGGPSVREYMDPNIQATIDPMVEQGLENINRQINAQAGQEENVGVGTGSRAGIERALTRTRGLSNLNAATQNALSQAYTQAAGLKNRDADRFLNASEASLNRMGMSSDRAANLAAARRGVGVDDARLMAGVGAANEARNQANLDWQRQQFGEQEGWNRNQLSWMANLAYGAPGSQTSTSSMPMYRGNPMMAGLGGAATGAAAGSSFGPWGTAIGGVGGFLGGYYG